MFAFIDVTRERGSHLIRHLGHNDAYGTKLTLDDFYCMHIPL